KVGPDAHAVVHVPDDALSSPEKFRSFVNQNTTRVSPSWQWEVRCEARATASTGELVVSFLFANHSDRQLSSKGKENPHIESFLFDTRARFVFDGFEVRPFALELAPKSFRYDRNIAAHSFNCSIAKVADAEFQTSHVATFEQNRYQTRTQPEAPFARLA